MTKDDKKSPEKPDLSQVAQEYFDLWQTHLSDPKTQAVMTQSLQAAQQAGQQFWQGVKDGTPNDLSSQAETMQQMMQAWQQFAAQPQQTDSSDDAKHSTPDAAHTPDASNVDDDKLAAVEDRLDALENRLDSMERQVKEKGD